MKKNILISILFCLSWGAFCDSQNMENAFFSNLNTAKRKPTIAPIHIDSNYLFLKFDEELKSELLAARIDFVLDKMLEVTKSVDSTFFDSQRFMTSSKFLVENYDQLLPYQKNKLVTCLTL